MSKKDKNVITKFLKGRLYLIGQVRQELNKLNFNTFDGSATEFTRKKHLLEDKILGYRQEIRHALSLKDIKEVSVDKLIGRE